MLTLDTRVDGVSGSVGSAGTSSVKSASRARRCTLDEDYLRTVIGYDPTTIAGANDWSDESAEEEELSDGIAELNDGQSIIGLSIGRQQSRLASPSTPAAEKAAALQGSIDDVFDDVADAGEEEEQESSEQSSLPTPIPQQPQKRHHAASQPLLPSPWKETAPGRYEFLDGATSPDSSKPSPESVSKRSPFPSLPRRFVPNFSSFSRIHMPNILSLSQSTNVNTTQATEQSQRQDTSTSSPSAHHTRSSVSGSTRKDKLFGWYDDEAIAPARRRVNSEYSLARQMSTASSLGDDSRWENVSEQINTRFRALRDSWIDSNFRMPSIKSFTSLNFGAPWGEILQHDDQGKEHDGTLDPQAFDPKSTRHKSLPLHSATLASTKGRDTPSAKKMNKVSAAQHPQFQKLLDTLTGDVVILGGYRGSILRSAKPPHQQLWVPFKVGLNLRKANLELGLNWEDELNSEDQIIPSGMLKNIGPVDISRRLFKRLRASKHAQEGRLRVWDYGYDWRLSPHLLSQQLIEVLEDLPCNGPSVPPNQRGAIIIAHSLGGLITRHAVNQRPDLFAGVLYAGVPQNCVNILGPLRNGDPVLLSSRVLTAQVNFTVRTSFALLPLDGKCFLDQTTKEPYPVDFFDVASWEEYRFSPVIARPLPPLAEPLPPPTLVNSIMNTIPRPSLIQFVRAKQQRTFSDRSIASAATSNAVLDETTQTSPLRNLQLEATALMQKDGVAPQMANSDNHSPAQFNSAGQQEDIPISTMVTIPKEAATAYLARALADVKQFKMDLAFRPASEAQYPPFAVLYGKSLPTVNGCRVRGRDGIKRADAYEDLTFASGDGVVLAKAAQIPTGYRVAKGGVVSTDRGHMGLLGDLEAVAKCMNAILAERARRSKKSSQADDESAVDMSRRVTPPEARDGGGEASRLSSGSTLTSSSVRTETGIEVQDRMPVDSKVGNAQGMTESDVTGVEDTVIGVVVDTNVR